MRKNKDERIPVGIGLGAYGLENVAADSSETSKRLQGRFLPALGFSSPGQGFIRGEKRGASGLWICGVGLYWAINNRPNSSRPPINWAK